ncbi:MAG: hypothetical protein HY290_11050, partial [Planctomycetia bacterium]|nr:hypothetical protein [Planctomycetia bacterium]
GSWQTLSFAYQAPAPPTPSVSNIHLVNDTQAPNDLVTSDARIAGSTSFSGSVAGLTIQVDADHNGTSDLTTTTAGDGTFQLDIARQGTTGPGITYGQANIQVRAGSNGNFGAWQSFNFTFQAPPAPPSIASLSLVNDTGTSGDSITSDPRIAGQFSGGSGSASGLTVQVDYNGDGVTEATATTDQNGNFTFDPGLTQGSTPPLAYGNRTLSVRAGRIDTYTNQMAFGPWAGISFNYIQAPVASQVINLHLASDTGTAGDSNTSDATVAGSLTNTADATGLIVQYDYNNDGTADLSLAPAADGSFTLNMGEDHGSTPAIGYGNVTVKVRAGKDQAGSNDKLYGDWQTLSFVYSQSPPGSPQATFYVDQLRLLFNTGTSGNPVTAEPEITGYVVGAANPANLPIEYDLNNDGVADGSTTTTAAGTFLVDLTSANLAAGAVTAKFRARQTDSSGVTTATNWSSFSFTYAPMPASVVGDLHLVNDTGDDSDNITSEPTIAGSLTSNGNALAGKAVQYAWSAGNEPVGTVYTANDGTFRVDLADEPELTAGPVTVFFRGVHLPDGAFSSVFGDWQSFEFTYAPVVFTAPVAHNLHLVNNTATANDPDTHDPRVTGSLTNAGEPLDKLPVQYDLNDDGTPEGIVSTDAQGNFLIDPRYDDIEDGPITIRVRSYVFDTTHLAYVYGDWVSLTFNFSWAPPTPPAIENLHLVSDDGAHNDDGITTDARIGGTLVSSEMPVAHLGVQVDTNGDGEADGTVYSDDQGHFVVDPGDLLVPGAVTVSLRTGVWDSHTGEIEYGDWQSLAFTWAPPLYSAPVVTGLHLTHDAEAPDDSVTSDPRVSGEITRAHGELSDVRVYFDVDCDGVADGQAAIDSVTGEFTVDPGGPQLSEGPVTLRIQASAQNPRTGAFLTSAWQTISYTYSVPPLQMGAVTGATAVSCPIGVVLSGTAPLPAGFSGDVLLEYGLHEAGVVDGSNLVTSADGSFQFVIPNDVVPGGTTQVRVRTSAYDSRKDATVASDWVIVSITAPLVNDSPLEVVELGLVNDTGSAGDGITSDARVRGTVSGSGALDNLPVQYDLTGDGDPEGTVNTDLDGNGTFVIDLRKADLAAGSVTVSARAGRHQSGGGYVYGDWEQFAFTYQPAPAASTATVDSLIVTRGDPTDGGAAEFGIQTSDAGIIHISGHVSRTSGSTSSLPVEYDVNGDGHADGTAQASIDGDGTFSADVNAASLPAGPITIAARAGTYDSQSGQMSYGSWNSQSYQNDPAAASNAPSTDDYLSQLSQATSAGGVGLVPCTPEFGTAIYARDVLKGGVTSPADGSFPLPYLENAGQAAIDLFSSLGTINFRSFEQLANPFMVSTTPGHTVAATNSDVTTTTTDGEGVVWTTETIIVSTLTTDVTVSSGTWHREAILVSTYSITTGDGNGHFKSQSGWRNYDFSVTGDSIEIHYTYDEQQEDTFQFVLSSGDPAGVAQPATVTTGSGTHAAELTAHGDKALNANGTFTAAESFDYRSGTIDLLPNQSVTPGVLPVWQMTSEDYDVTSSDHSGAPAVNAHQHKQQSWLFSENVTINTSSESSNPSYVGLGWHLQEHSRLDQTVDRGADHRSQATITDDATTLSTTPDGTGDALAFSHHQNIIIDRSNSWSDASGSASTTLHSEQNASNVGTRGIGAGHLDFVVTFESTATSDSSYSRPGRTLSQTQVTTIETNATTSRDLNGTQTTAHTTTDRHVKVDATLIDVVHVTTQGTNAGLTIASSLNDSLTTHRINQFVEHTAGDEGAASPTAVVRTIVSDTGYVWSSHDTASVSGTTSLPGGSLTINDSSDSTDVGSSSIVTVSNTSQGADGPSVTIGGYGTVARNSTTTNGSGGGNLTWSTNAQSSVAATNVLQPGVMIAISSSASAFDLGGGNYGMSFEEIDVTNADGSQSVTGTFSSSSSYAGQTSYSRSSSDSASGFVSNGPGNSALIDIHTSSQVTGGVTQYTGNSTGSGSIGPGGMSLTLAVTDDSTDHNIFTSSLDAAVDQFVQTDTGFQQSSGTRAASQTGTSSSTSHSSLIGSLSGSSHTYTKTTTTSSMIQGTSTASSAASGTSSGQIATANSWGTFSSSGSTSRSASGNFNLSSSSTTTDTNGSVSSSRTSHSAEAGTYSTSRTGASQSQVYQGTGNYSAIVITSGSSSSSGDGTYATSDDSSTGAGSESHHHDEFSESGNNDSQSTVATSSWNGTGDSGANSSSNYSFTRALTSDSGTYTAEGASDQDSADGASSSSETSSASFSGTTTSDIDGISRYRTTSSGSGFSIQSSGTNSAGSHEHGTYQSSDSSFSSSGSGGSQSGGQSSSSRSVDGTSTSTGTSHTHSETGTTGPMGWTRLTTDSDSDSSGNSTYHTNSSAASTNLNGVFSTSNGSTSHVEGTNHSNYETHSNSRAGNETEFSSMSAREKHDVIGDTTTNYVSDVATSASADNSGGTNLTNVYTVSDTNGNSTDDYLIFSASSVKSGNNEQGHSDLDEGKDIGHSQAHSDYASHIGTGVNSYSDDGTSSAWGTITFHRESKRWNNSTSTPAPGLTKTSGSGNSTTSDGNGDYSSQSASSETLSDGVTTSTEDSTGNANEQGTVVRKSNETETTTGTTVMEINGMNADVTFDDSSSDENTQSGNYTSHSNSTSHTVRTMAAGGQTASASGASTSTYSESGTISGIGGGKLNHEIGTSGTSAGTANSNGSGRSNGTYLREAQGASAFGNGTNTYNNTITDTSTVTSHSDSTGTVDINLFGDKIDDGSGSTDDTTTESITISTSTESGGTNTWNSTILNEQTSWSNHTRTKKSPTTYLYEHTEQEKSGNSTSNDTGSSAYNSQGLTSYSQTAASSGSSTRTFSAKMNSRMTFLSGLSEGKSTITKNRHNESASGTILSFDSSNSSGSGDAQGITFSGSSTSTFIADLKGSSGDYASKGIQEEIPHGTKDREYETGASTESTVHAAGTLTNSFSSSGSPSTDGSVNIDATTTELNWGTLVATIDTRINGPGSSSTHIDVDRSSMFTGKETRSTGTVTYAGSESTRNIPKKISLVAGFQDDDSTTDTSDATATLEDGATSHSTSQVTKAIVTSVGDKIGPDQPLGVRTWSQTQTTTSRTTGDANLSGAQGYSRGTVSDGTSEEVHKAHFGLLQETTRLDTVSSESTETGTTSGSLGTGSSSVTSRSYSRVNSQGDTRTVTAWSKSDGEGSNKLGDTTTTWTSRGESEASGWMTIDGTNDPVLHALNTRSKGGGETVVETVSAGTSGTTRDFRRTLLYTTYGMALAGEQIAVTEGQSTADDHIYDFKPANPSDPMAPPVTPVHTEEHMTENGLGPSYSPLSLGTDYLSGFGANTISRLEADALWAGLAAEYAAGRIGYLGSAAATNARLAAYKWAGGAEAAWSWAKAQGDYIWNTTGDDYANAWDRFWGVYVITPLVGANRLAMPGGLGRDFAILAYAAANFTSFFDPTPISDSYLVAMDIYDGDLTSAAFNGIGLLVPGGGGGRSGKQGMDAVGTAGSKFMKSADDIAVGGSHMLSRHADEGLRFGRECASAVGNCFVTGTPVAVNWNGEPIEIAQSTVVDVNESDWGIGWLIAGVGILAATAHVHSHPATDEKRRRRQSIYFANGRFHIEPTDDRAILPPLARGGKGGSHGFVFPLAALDPSGQNRIPEALLIHGNLCQQTERAPATTVVPAHAARERRVMTRTAASSAPRRRNRNLTMRRPAPRTFLWALPLILAGFCFWQALPGTRSRSRSDAAAIASSAAHGTTIPSAKRTLVTRPIQDIRPGMRVLAKNPELVNVDVSQAEFTPENTHLVVLHMLKRDGGELTIERLMSVDELAFAADDQISLEFESGESIRAALTATADDFDAESSVGTIIELDLPELGAEGPAEIVAVRSCPEIEPDDCTGRRLVTSVFRHAAANVVDVSTEATDSSIGATANHPFWSEDRQAFIPAGELRSGERLRRADGRIDKVTAIVPRAGPEPVFNLEVDGEHVYFVGTDGLLVHNSYPGNWEWVGRRYGPGLENQADRAGRRIRMRRDGVAEIQEYAVNGTHFDDFVNGRLIDYKDHRAFERFVDNAGNFRPWFSGRGALRDEARRQIEAAAGTVVEWRVGSEKVAEAMRSLLRSFISNGNLVISI